MSHQIKHIEKDLNSLGTYKLHMEQKDYKLEIVDEKIDNDDYLNELDDYLNNNS